MTWSYTPATMAALDQVRLYIGDTDSANQQLQNEEINFYLSNQTDTLVASINAANGLAAKYSRQVDQAGEGLRLRLEVLYDHYVALASSLRMQLARGGVSPYAGGLSITEKQNDLTDSDLVQPFARKEQFLEPSTESGLGDDLLSSVPATTF